MADEQPIPLKSVPLPKKGKRTDNLECVIHVKKASSIDKITPVTEKSILRIKEVSNLRLQSCDPLIRQEHICSNIPDELNSSSHGYHRTCYQTFTNLKYVKKHIASDELQDEPDKKRKRSCSQNVLFPSDKCLFCDKKFKHKPAVSGHETLTKCVTETSENSIKEAATLQNDQTILSKIIGIDMVAREVHYHNSCRRDYTRNPERHGTAEESTSSSEQMRAHADAFSHVCDHVLNSIIHRSQVERMTMLRERYCLYMQEHHQKHYNANYKTQKLKEKLIKHFGCRIKFWRPNYRSELVYSEEIPTGQAVETAFEAEASEERRMEETAFILRRHIKDAYLEHIELPWPSSADVLSNNPPHPPSSLTKFLRCLLTGESSDKIPDRVVRLEKSFSDDLCYAVTLGKWKMAKHLPLGMTIRHLTGSSEIITLLNRFGHCTSYSALLELETAMCDQVTASNRLLPHNISNDQNVNVVTHFSWDNFDLREETPSGAGTTHSTHGIVIQEKSVHDKVAELPPSIPRSKKRSGSFTPAELTPCYVKKSEPNVSVTKHTVMIPDQLMTVNKTDFLWILCRYFSHDQQIIPSWAGWISSNKKPSSVQPNTVDYMPPVCSPITENSTVHHVLKLSQNASRSVGQTYTFVTFDLAAAKKAYAIVWQDKVFSNVIVGLGVFHTMCAYFKALGKLLEGTGFSEVLLESGVCASGSIDGVLKGKHYNRALRVHKLMLEALERMLFRAFADSQDIKNIYEKIKSEFESRKDKDLWEVVEFLQTNTDELQKKFYDFKQGILRGEHGKTQQFWMQYIERIWLILHFLGATKENNLEMHLYCLEQMCPLMFSMDHQNYARYIPVYMLTLMNLPSTHPGAEELLIRGGFSVCRTNYQCGRNPVDLTIEQTINKHAKSEGGVIGFSRNSSAYYRWCVTRHTRAQYLDATIDIAGMNVSEDCSHKDLRPSEIAKSEHDVQTVMAAFDNFMNPFEVDEKDKLFSLSSGAPAPSEIESDLLRCDQIGKSAYDSFVKDRLVDKTISFHEPIQRKSLKTFALIQKKKTLKSTSNKIVNITAQRNIFGQLLILSQKYSLSLRRVLSYPLSPVPWALATPDDKAKLLHLLECDDAITTSPPKELASYIIDGNALLQSLTALPLTFGELAEKVFKCLPFYKSARVDFVTDTYLEYSIKAYERKRRGSSNTFILKGPSTRVPRDWKSFLCNDSNKTGLLRLILAEWQKDIYAPRLLNNQLYFSIDDSCKLPT